MERGGNTLSPVIRKAWDGGDLAIMTRKNSVKATAPHISIISHITIEELRSCLTRTDAASGFANRFIFAVARRSKLLAMGGSLSDREIIDMGKEVVQRLAALPFDEKFRPNSLKPRRRGGSRHIPNSPRRVPGCWGP